VADATVAVLQEVDRDLGGAQIELDGPDDHLGRVLPALRAEVEPLVGVECEPAHPAMDVRESRREDAIEDERRRWRAEVAMMWRHRTGFDGSPESRSHDEFVAVAKFGDEQTELTEVIGAIGIAEDDEFAAHEGDGIEVGPTESSLRHSEHPRAGGDG